MSGSWVTVETTYLGSVVIEEQVFAETIEVEPRDWRYLLSCECGWDDQCHDEDDADARAATHVCQAALP